VSGFAAAARLSANRRFTFAASRRLARSEWPEERNQGIYGAGQERRWGTGENYEAHFVFEGAPDPVTGMVVNLATAKQVLTPVIDRYDHHFLNLDTPPFGEVPPTAERVAAALLDEGRNACAGLPVRPVACHLVESEDAGATAFHTGAVEREAFLEFSAARRTYSPHLSDAENDALFGAAASSAGHGHGYRLRVVLRGAPDADTGMLVPFADVAGALGDVHALLDHKNLNQEVAELASEPMTTECLARFVFRRLARTLPVARVTLHENPWLFAGFDGRDSSLGLRRSFSAAHCLRLPSLSAEENRELFGKCSNPNGHGHRYTVETTISGQLDERTGVLSNLLSFDAVVGSVLAPWAQRHLDFEVEEFRARPSTGENILLALWPRLESALPGRLTRLCLQETENNRFTLRRRGGE
jgi:6-pyruvoyltetrahydropterin/6-carboxytetrahydropterin synthase